MAKSLRSKHKRRMRAIKRVRYGEKELNRLNEIVKKSVELEKVQEESKPLAEAKTMEIDTMTNESNVEDSQRNHKTMLDKNGQYPVWMNGRRVRKQKKIIKRLKKSKAKSKK